MKDNINYYNIVFWLGDNLFRLAISDFGFLYKEVWYFSNKIYLDFIQL